jgi:hypothetical protein
MEYSSIVNERLTIKTITIKLKVKSQLRHTTGKCVVDLCVVYVLHF